MLMKKMFCLFAVCVWVQAIVKADTRIPSGDLYGGTWNSAGSPYILEGDVTVVDGYTLTIEAGTEVRGESSTTNLRVEGKLVAEGTKAKPITFTASSTKWDGLYFYYADTDCVMSHCVVDKSNYAIKMSNSSFAITDCTLENNHGQGFYLLASSPWIERCRIINNGSYGVYGDYNSHPQIRNCLFANNEGSKAGAIYGQSYMEVLNCTIANNKASYSSYYGGVHLTSDTIVRNCIFSGNRNSSGNPRSFYDGSGYRPEITYCLVEEGYEYGSENTFGAASFKNPTTMAGGILFEPGTDNGQPADYSPEAGSLGVNAGNNNYAAFLNTDVEGKVRIHNSTVDMGCFEYAPLYANGTCVTIERAVRLTCSTETGRKYQFWWCSDLSSADWQPLGDIIVGTGDVVEMFDSLSSPDCRFYRVSDWP